MSHSIIVDETFLLLLLFKNKFADTTRASLHVNDLNIKNFRHCQSFVLSSTRHQQRVNKTHTCLHIMSTTSKQTSLQSHVATHTHSRLCEWTSLREREGEDGSITSTLYKYERESERKRNSKSLTSMRWNERRHVFLASLSCPHFFTSSSFFVASILSDVIWDNKKEVKGDVSHQSINSRMKFILSRVRDTSNVKH